MNKFIWIFGAISGILGSIAEYLVYGDILPYESFGAIRLFKIFLLVICVVFAVVAIKKINGQISLARTLLVSILVSLVRSIFLIGGFLLMYYPNGERFEPGKKIAMEMSIKRIKDEQIEAQKSPLTKDKKVNIKEKIEDQRNAIDNQFSITGYPVFSIMGSVVTAVFAGVFLGLIVANKSKNSQ
jgi:hypothetical protein